MSLLLINIILLSAVSGVVLRRFVVDSAVAKVSVHLAVHPYQDYAGGMRMGNGFGDAVSEE